MNELNKKLLKTLDYYYKPRKAIKYLKMGADPNLIIDKGRNATPIMIAAFNKDTKFIQALLDAGADMEIMGDYMTNDLGLNAFLIACRSGDIDTVEFLLHAGADLQSTSKNGANGIMHASAVGSVKVIKYLYDKGLDINAHDKIEQTALMYAFKNMEYTRESYDSFDTELIQTLIDLGIELNAKDENGATALSHFIKAGCYEITRKLLDSGADPNTSDQNLLFAVENNNEFVLDFKALLKHYGAEDKPYFAELKASTACEECNRFIHVNSPVKKVQCPDCLTFTNVEDKFWYKFFKQNDNYDWNDDINIHESEFTVKEPECLSCGKPMNVEGVDIENVDRLKCGSCGEMNILTTVPDWFKRFEYKYRYPKKIICNTFPDVKISDDSKPVALKCTSCSAVLSINSLTLINFNCEHCGAEQQLHDEVWLAFHPAKKRESWYIVLAES